MHHSFAGCVRWKHFCSFTSPGQVAARAEAADAVVVAVMAAASVAEVGLAGEGAAELAEVGVVEVVMAAEGPAAEAVCVLAEVAQEAAAQVGQMPRFRPSYRLDPAAAAVTEAAGVVELGMAG